MQTETSRGPEERGPVYETLVLREIQKLSSSISEIKHELASMKQTQQEFMGAVGCEFRELSSAFGELKTELAFVKQLNSEASGQTKNKIGSQTSTQQQTQPSQSQPTQESTSTGFFRYFRSPAPPPPPPTPPTPRVLVVKTYHSLDNNIAVYLNKEAKKLNANITFVEYSLPLSKRLTHYTPNEFKACIFTFFCGTSRWYESLNGPLSEVYKKLSEDFPIFKLVCLQESCQSKGPLLLPLKEMETPYPLVFYGSVFNPENTEVTPKIIHSLIQTKKELD
eukprot:TRINITY_DN5034_c0_g1_i1.p1 TRINITY_DN5034_c0_g1~~TRINITY_DN5034_c0_g1_i1.p1  ORF type:complete len:279 (-),score=53.00 TRINITY_DN5034_c0_g1_i1:75-911(-)